MSFIGPPSAVGSQNRAEIKFREPFSLPPVGSDEQHVYLVGVNQDAPFDQYDIAGLSFAKRHIHPDASLLSNEGKVYNFVIPTKILTDKQAKALKKELATRRVVIPARPNVNYNPDLRPDEPEYWPRQEVDVLPHLLFLRAAEYNPGAQIEEQLRARVEVSPPCDESEEVEKAVYESQKKSGNKK